MPTEPDSVSEHPERALVRRAIAEKLTAVPVTTNPLAIAMGMILLTATAERISLGFELGQDFTQGNGFVQGGIVAAMLDFGMAFAAFAHIPPDATIATVSQTTNFFRAARAGAFVVEAELEKIGRTMINARAALLAADGQTLASATAPIAVIARRR